MATVQYIVTSGNDTLEVGDRFIIDDSCCLVTVHGWINPEDVPVALEGVSYEVDVEAITSRIEQLRSELDELTTVLTEHGIELGETNGC